MTDKVKHILGLSGGKDSAALALLAKELYSEDKIDYFFIDTGYELPETLAFLDRLESKLGYIHRLSTSPQNQTKEDYFRHLLALHHNHLPSPRTQWCVVEMKLKPMKQWLNSYIQQGYKIKNYLSVRADEPKKSSSSDNSEPIECIYPFLSLGITHNDINDILLKSRIALPDYHHWRSRPGCSFCFYQSQIEWLNLMDQHPHLFAEAKSIEQHSNTNKTSEEHNYWQGAQLSLSRIDEPRVKQAIRHNHRNKIAAIHDAKSNESSTVHPLCYK
ncbi:phosphoadenosine phosphosulfate reductase family protein [Pseudoalteromonas sp. SMS1]|uniref:phosphoadenosine phosphosulfate reductase domain-containing protein n=1 Tax=Pseudoalteromonas sp. SMS1 TaxID=2908894 RepID=UPI001F22B1FE|nr:phosphoadenosine phosphosulfate reductase family protein [Pseudoalteromonas sp. SMS1]MCF2856159.1 phosphoadenosine phosphosulfate reductase family protein [Pseudoalteromonas sp. SMS1]